MIGDTQPPLKQHATQDATGSADGQGHQSHLERDVFCVYCGYNLRGLRPRDGCPECGNPVSKSLRGESLRFAPPRWLRKLHHGFVLLEVSFATLLFLPVPFFLVWVWEMDATDGNAVVSRWLGYVVAVALVLAAVIALPGMLLVTGCPPRLVRYGRGSASRAVTRVTACLLALSVAGLLITSNPSIRGNLAVATLRTALSGIIPLLLAVLGLSYAWFTAGMLQRGTAPRSSPNRVVFWLFALFLACSLCYAGSLTWNTLTGGVGDLVATLFLAELGVGLLSLAALFITTRRMRRLLARFLRES